MSKALDQLQATWRDRGFSLTEARKTVFGALQDQEPQTMKQIVAGCPSIDRTSVYRTVSLFTRLGIVQKLQMGWKYKIELSGEFRDHHHHLTCQRCGKIISFEEDPKLETLLQEIAKQHDFEMRDHVLEIQGLCSNCRPQYA